MMRFFIRLLLTEIRRLLRPQWPAGYACLIRDDFVFEGIIVVE